MNESFSGRVGVVGSGRIIYVASLFLLHIGLARTLSVEGYGSFQQVYLFNVLLLMFTLGIPETLYYFLPRLEDNERGGFIGQTILLLGVTGIAVFLVLWFGAPLFARWQDNPLIAGNLKLFGIYALFIVFSSFADPVFIYYKRVRYLFILSAAHGLFFLVITVLRFLIGISIETIFASMAVFSSFKCLAAFWFLLSITRITGPVRFFMAKQPLLLQASFALPIALTNTIDALARWLDKIVVSFFLGTESLGAFSVGAIEIPFIAVFVSTVYGVISPLLNELEHKGDHVGFAKLAGKVLSFTAKAVWPLAAYLFMFADHLVPLVFAEGYERAVAPFRIYLLVMPLRIFLFGVLVVALGKPRIVLIASAWTLILDVVLNVTFVKWIGFLGPAIATVAVTYLQAAYLFTYVIKRLGTGIGSLVPFRRLWHIALASVIASGIAYFLTVAYQNDLKAVLISLTIMMGAYIFLGSRFGFFRILSLSDLMRGDLFGNKD